MKPSTLEHLGPAGSELCDNGGRIDASYRKCLDMLERLHGSELEKRAAFIERATADLGLHADRLADAADAPGSFSMDLFPRILRPAEWERIQAGVLQRARAFGEYIRDLYGQQRIIHEGFIPAEIAFEDPAFHPELHGIPMDGTNPITVGAVDLIRTAGGEWQVLENRFSTPTGISYVIQIRRILAQALPEVFASLPVIPVASFATRLSEALAETSGGGRTLAVLLSEGESGRHFFEESFLARHMGIPLARTGDIVVRDGKVFLKTIQGLLRVNVIHRRLEAPQLDPVAFATGLQSGVPGLIQCVRRGTVRIVNALGCDAADNRALLRYSDSLIRHYTGEAPLLRTVPTYHGYDQDQREWIADHADSLVLKTVCHPETLSRRNPEAYRLFLEGNLAAVMRADPRLVVAQQLPAVPPLPVYRGGAFAGEGLSLRVFFLSGRRPYVLPGGLSRIFHAGDERLPVGRRYHALKDTWALRERHSRGARTGRLEPEISISETPLTSRAAEAFYWIGRYLERGRGTARMLNTLEELRWGELAPGERELYSPLLAAIIEASGQKAGGRRRAADLSSLTHPLLFDGSNPASVASCLAAVRWNASSIRSFITPEFWQSIEAACTQLGGGSAPKLRGPALREAMEGIVHSCDRIRGTGERTLLYDAGWHFLEIGMLIERAQTHVAILARVLPRIALRQWEHLRDDSDLTALLRLLGALDAYHRKYRSRAYLDRVAQLLWQTPGCRSSVLFATRGILGALEALHDDSGARVEPAVLIREMADFNQWLVDLPLVKIFPARALELDRGLTRKADFAQATASHAEDCMGRMRAFLETFHERLEDAYFSHHPENGKGAG